MQALRTLRKARKLSVARCADAVGISARTWANYESGSTEPTWEKASEIADFLGASLDDLAGRTQKTA